MNNNLASLVCFLCFLTQTITGQNNIDQYYINKVLSEIVSQNSDILHKDSKITDGFNSTLQAPAKWYITQKRMKDLGPYFSFDDKDYYLQQVERNRNIELLKEGVFENYKFIKKKKIINFIAKSQRVNDNKKKFNYNEEFNKRLGKIQEFGLPMISKDGKFVLLKYCRYLDSKTYHTFLRIYQKKNEKWVMIKSIMEYK